MRTVTFNRPFRESDALASPQIAPALYPVSIAGRGYQIDTASDQYYWASVDVTRPQQDTGDEAGQQSLSNVDLWRRAYSTWHYGAGQSRGDDAASNRGRFATSKGVNVWDRWQLSLLNDTVLASAGSASPAALVSAGGSLVHQAGAALAITADGVVFTPLTTLASTPVCQAVTDGTDVYVACVDGKIKKVPISGSGITDAYTLANVNVMGFSKGRLWAGAGNVLSWMTVGSGSPTAIVGGPTQPSWIWSAICDGSRATYAAGSAGDFSAIYRIPIKADGTGLDAATLACPLPDGEKVTALVSYLGFVLIGTTKGFRLAAADGTGDLTFGALIPTPAPVYGFEPQDRFVWFGWTNFDDVSTGLGRVDLSTFTDTLVPAYASDLMFNGQGTVSSVATFNGKRFFTIPGQGAVAELSTKVASGAMTESESTFGIDDKKVTALINISHDVLDGSVELYLSADASGFAIVAESSKQGSVGPENPYPIEPISGRRFSLKAVLFKGVGNGPIVRSITLSARPTPNRGERIVLPLLISEQADISGLYKPYDPPEEVRFLRGLVRKGSPVQLQIGREAMTVWPANYRWLPERQTVDRAGWSGVCIMEMREVTL